MVLNRTIQIRLTKDQYEQIKSYTQLKGFSSLSSYLRHVALNQDFALHQRIQEIHRHLMGEPPKARYRKNAAHRPFI